MWPIQRGTSLPSALEAAPTGSYTTPDGAVFNGPGTANTFTAYATLIASIPFDCAGFWIHEKAVIGTAGAYQMEYARGAASSEVSIVRTGGQHTNFWTNQIYYPFYVPLPLKRGERISARMMTTLTSTGVITNTRITLAPAGQLILPSFNRVEILNLDIAAALPPTLVNRNYSAGPPVEGGITELSASIASRWRAWSVLWSGNGVLGDMSSAHQFFLRVGASNGVRVDGGFYPTGKLRNIVDGRFGPYPCDIAAGSRVLAECVENDGTGANDRTYPILYGWS